MTRSLLWCLIVPGMLASAQTVPTFQYTATSAKYTLVGQPPSSNASTNISTLVVPVALAFESPAVTVDTGDLRPLLQSPVFKPFAFPGGSATQYADALLRTTFPNAKNWHTLLAPPRVQHPITVNVPPANGYVLTSKHSGAVLAIADIEFVQREIFKQIGKQPGAFVLAVTRNTAFYPQADATICCSWGTHGVDAGTGNSFVLASYLNNAPGIVQDQDVQAISEQVAEWIYDPLHDPLVRDPQPQPHGNVFPAWMRPSTMHPGDESPCGGREISTPYFLLEPTDTNRKNNVPASPAFEVHNGSATYHVQNVALLRWYVGQGQNLGRAYSFPDMNALTRPAQACAAPSISNPTATPRPNNRRAGTHELIGYWTAYESDDGFPLSEVSPQWDVIIVAFASPDHSAPEGTLTFRPPSAVSPEQFKSQIAVWKARGRKVLLSLGGGGEFFTMQSADSLRVFVASVSNIVKEYGFDGVDLDFESPSLELDPGDTDFQHPRTASIVNLIAGLRQLRQRFGTTFMITLVPEGPQFPAGFRTYGGQFGSYLPIAYALGNSLSFVDVQDYNTPPLEGLDGEIYQSGNVDYHAAMTELLLRGFPVAVKANQHFPALPSHKIAVGFLADYTTPEIMEQAMRYLITGAKPAQARYILQNQQGYPDFLGAMLWNINADRAENYKYSNLVGPELESLHAPR